MNLKQINNELKTYVNEATLSGIKYSNKLLKLVNKNFYVDLPIENYLHLDIVIKENGNIIMRDDEYKTLKKVKNREELEERYKSFKEDIDKVLKRKNDNYKVLNVKNGFVNLFITLLITIVVGVICYNYLIELLSGNYWNFIWFIIFITFYNVIPRLGEDLRRRYKEAYLFIKRLFK